MRVVVAYKWSRDAADATVRADGSIDWRNAKMSAGEDDPAALAVAKDIADASGGQVVGLTIGDGDPSWALARGVEEAFSVPDAPFLIDNARTAAVLAEAIRRIGADIVVIGDSKQDPGVCVALAGQLGWPGVAGLLSASVEDGRVLAVRRVGGQRQTISIATPAVLGVAAEADVDKVPGMKELLAARKRPLTKIALADLGLAPQDLTPAGTEEPESRTARVFEGDQAAAQLVAALRAESVL